MSTIYTDFIQPCATVTNSFTECGDARWERFCFFLPASVTAGQPDAAHLINLRGGSNLGGNSRYCWDVFPCLGSHDWQIKSEAGGHQSPQILAQTFRFPLPSFLPSFQGLSHLFAPFYVVPSSMTSTFVQVEEHYLAMEEACRGLELS